MLEHFHLFLDHRPECFRILTQFRILGFQFRDAGVLGVLRSIHDAVGDDVGAIPIMIPSPAPSLSRRDIVLRDSLVPQHRLHHHPIRHRLLAALPLDPFAHDLYFGCYFYFGRHNWGNLSPILDSSVYPISRLCAADGRVSKAVAEVPLLHHIIPIQNFWRCTPKVHCAPDPQKPA